MSLNDRILARFAELEAASRQIQTVKVDGYELASPESSRKWCVSALNLMGNAFGQSSVHCQSFKDYSATHPTLYWGEFLCLRGIFNAAKEDYEGGHFFSVQRVVSGELFGDFVVLAKQSLSEGYKDVAAVLACAALEDALKRYALSQDLDVQDKSMQEVVAALKTKGLVSGAQKTLLDTMPKIRDYAMHANWDKIKPEDVSGIIGFVERFLVSKFSE